MSRYFITATGTGVGKTMVTQALALAAKADGQRTVALKPLETEVDMSVANGLGAKDAAALEAASSVSGLAATPGFYRVPPPLSPLGATLAGNAPPPPLDALTQICRDALDAHSADVSLVEGAGGVLVPIDEEHDVADLIAALGIPAIVVAHDGLGVLSFSLTACEALSRRGIDIAALILSRHEPRLDESVDTNAQILRQRLGVPVLPFGPITSDDALEAAGRALWSGLA